LGPDGQGILDARVIYEKHKSLRCRQDITDSQETTTSRIFLTGVYYIEVLTSGNGIRQQNLSVERLVSFSESRSGGLRDIPFLTSSFIPFRPGREASAKENWPTPGLCTGGSRRRRDKSIKTHRSFWRRIRKKRRGPLCEISIEIFPDFYDALDLLGTEYLGAGHSDVCSSDLSSGRRCKFKRLARVLRTGQRIQHPQHAERGAPAIEKGYRPQSLTTRKPIFVLEQSSRKTPRHWMKL
jgi:hypothetical protein